jgi:hypothetical protein
MENTLHIGKQEKKYKMSSRQWEENEEPLSFSESPTNFLALAVSHHSLNLHLAISEYNISH